MDAEGDRRESNDSDDDDDEADRESGDYDFDEGSRKRKSSYGFDEYKFESPLLDDNEDARKTAEKAAQQEAQRFMQMTRLKTTEYSKMDMVTLASSVGGLILDDSLVEPVLIPSSSTERADIVHEIYGPEIQPQSEPFKDPAQALESIEEDTDMPEKIRSPPNLYEALHSNFLKSSYKSALYRLFLIGTHDESMGHFIEWNKELVEIVNIQSTSESITGVLCTYEYYFIHVLEGSEDNLTRFLQKYSDDHDPSTYEWNLKFHYKSGKYVAREHTRFRSVQSWVLGVFRINQRQLGLWRGEKVFPNKMHSGDIPAGGFREKYFHFMRQCLVMIFTYNRMTPGDFNPGPDSHDEFPSQHKKSYDRAKIQRFRSLDKVITPITFIQYVLSNKDNPNLKIRSVREHLDLFGGIPPYASPSDTEWPPPCKIAPYD